MEGFLEKLYVVSTFIEIYSELMTESLYFQRMTFIIKINKLLFLA